MKCVKREHNVVISAIMSQFAKSRTRTIGLYVHVIGYLSHIASQLSFQNSWYPGVCPSGGQCCIAIKVGCRISQHLTSAIDGQRIYAIRYHRADLPFPACCTTACEAAKHPNNRTCRPRAARVVRGSGILRRQDWKTPTMRAGSQPRKRQPVCHSDRSFHLWRARPRSRLSTRRAGAV